MKTARAHASGQAGYTLIEVVITLALGAILMSALSSVVLTTWRATETATSRVEASGQIRSFQYFAYDDFAQSDSLTLVGCTPSTPCATPIALRTVTYAWDGSTNFLDRTNSQGTVHAATDVTAFSWFVDTDSTVVVNLTVSVRSYSESQTFRFFPRLNS